MYKLFLRMGINHNLDGADGHRIWLETEIKMISKDENDSEVFMALKHKISLLLQQI